MHTLLMSGLTSTVCVGYRSEARLHAYYGRAGQVLYKHKEMYCWNGCSSGTAIICCLALLEVPFHPICKGSGRGISPLHGVEVYGFTTHILKFVLIYHANINLQQSYWAAENTNLNVTKTFWDYIQVTQYMSNFTCPY